MAVTAAMVKELRERTGLGMLDCKNALVESDGDMEKAIENLRKNSALKAAKKSGRTTANGLLGVKVAADGSKGAIVEVNIETDFAAKNEKFIGFVAKVASELYDSVDGDLETLLQAGLNSEREVLVQEIGENITVRRGQILTAPAGGSVGSYVHGDNLKGSLVGLTNQDRELGRDIAMHVTAISPAVVKGEDVPATVIAKEREIYTAQARESGKPEEIVEKMVEGRVRKYLAEVSLVDQVFVKSTSDKETVGSRLKSKGSDVSSFIRFEVGEGLEVANEDFAAEVAAQLKDKD